MRLHEARQWGLAKRNAGSKADSERLPGNAQIGDAVAISGDGGTVVVGAPGHGPAPAGVVEGAVYLFTEALSAGWSSASQAPLSGTEYQYLGEDVALSADGNTIVLGRPVLTQNTSHTFSSPDGAIVLTEAPGGNWSQTATITGVVPSGTGFSVSTQAAVSGDGQTVAIAGVGASGRGVPTGTHRHIPTDGVWEPCSG